MTEKAQEEKVIDALHSIIEKEEAKIRASYPQNDANLKWSDKHKILCPVFYIPGSMVQANLYHTVLNPQHHNPILLNPIN